MTRKGLPVLLSGFGLFLWGCPFSEENSDEGSSRGTDFHGDTGSENDDGDTSGSGGEGEGGETFELISDRAAGWGTIYEDAQGDIFAAGMAYPSDDGYGPIVEISRITGGAEGDLVKIDPGAPLFGYDIGGHPSGDLMLSGSVSKGGGSFAWVGRVAMAGGGAIVWEREFGTGVSNQDSGFWAMVPTSEGCHLGGYGAEYYGAQIALRTFVSYDGTGGAHSLEFEATGGDVSALSGGEVSDGGDVVLAGFYGGYTGSTRPNEGYVVLIRGDETVSTRIAGIDGLSGGGFDAGGRLFVYGMRTTDPVDYAADLYIAELDPTDLAVIWSRTHDYSHDDILLEGEVSDDGEILLGWKSWEGDSECSWVGKFDSDGEEIWVAKFPRRTIIDVAYARDKVHVLASGEALPEKDGEPYRGWLVKLDAEGGI